MPDELSRAIEALPEPVAKFFRKASNNPEYDCAALTMQMTIHFRGKKVGGLNRRISEWYVSKVFVQNHGGANPLEHRGFRNIVKNEHHSYWAMSGSGALEAFSDAISEMTGVPI